MRAVWTKKTQTSSSTSALSSPFFSLSSTLTLSPLSPPFPFFHLSVRDKSQHINFSFGRKSKNARLSARNLPSLIPPQITISLHPFIQYLSFFYHLSTLLLSFSLTRTCSLTVSEVKDSKDGSFSKIPQVCFLSIKPLTQSKLFWN